MRWIDWIESVLVSHHSRVLVVLLKDPEKEFGRRPPHNFNNTWGIQKREGKERQEKNLVATLASIDTIRQAQLLLSTLAYRVFIKGSVRILPD